jgi:hypothetical protein
MFRMRHFAASTAALSAIFVGVSGCESDNDEPLAYEHRTIQGDARNDVPATASLVKEGHEPLMFQAPSDGTVWVYNASDHRLVYSGSLRLGQTVNVDPDHDFVTVDGRKVLDTKMDDFDKHQILFGPATLTTTANPAATPAPASVTIEQPASPRPAEVRVKPGGEVEVQPAQPAQPARVKVVPSN